MIQLSHNYTLPEREEELIPIKVVGVGSAGCNALDRIVLDGMDKSDLIAVNTDSHSMGELDLIRCGLDQARRASLAKNAILNCKPWQKLYAFFKR